MSNETYAPDLNSSQKAKYKIVNISFSPSLCKVGGLMNQKSPKPAHSEKQESPKQELNKLKNVPSWQPMSLLHLKKPPGAKYLIQHHSQDTNTNN